MQPADLLSKQRRVERGNLAHQHKLVSGALHILLKLIGSEALGLGCGRGVCADLRRRVLFVDMLVRGALDRILLQEELSGKRVVFRFKPVQMQLQIVRMRRKW